MDEWIMTQAAFDRLWSRVQGNAPTAPPPDDEAALRRFLDETGQTLAFERQLLCRSGRDRAAMLALCRATRSRLCRLRAACFLLTGEVRTPPDACPVRGGYLADLRRDWLCAEKRAGEYRAEAQAVQDAKLRALYEELAGEETAHADALRAVIGRCFG